MHKLAAELRHRELTQEIYNIGDEVAEYLEHLIEAIEDWDPDLAVDCLAELGDIVADARVDAGRVVGELIGLRQALVSGVRSGTISATSSGRFDVEAPRALDAARLEDMHPIDGPPLVVHQLAAALQSRTSSTADFLRDLVDYVLEQTDSVARNLDMVSLPHLYNRVGRLAQAAADGWQATVVNRHRAYVRTMRGHNLPAFLEERARVNAIVAKVAAKRAAQKGTNQTA
ncbi:hypothetical protein [Corynebacterium massiliense]|uniref:Uncharacterized protein n=1 Tax=Corynebacterium massiliense DSM 45435 TaxID=1121364 RepID=A0ABY7UAT7_9CORY|nr:hypothetical protein [Corynebacterium massiliense]WCZ32967.1 hypothetical protein CMASS_07685 [Corynebacterium massiliense DSM 45435]